ncbi:MAG: 23S rRNA (uracil(1939)-C(5))-methyltransferase RlmD [Endomicrobium sp.]|jgi:23S rRNA (uracil-5-)-methyltransferase RumA|nr:23S rRNA (uracil(1939)-C(5))-methyltransferase RlmD [Endomicrobium sp.]
MSLKNKVISVKAEKIVFPGRCLCRCEDGIALFTEGLLPQETADVLVIKDKKSFREGIVKLITSKSGERIDPICSSFGKCGGCTFQNTDYKNQIKYKKAYINELLSVFGVEIGEILPSPEVWNYRNKMEFSFFNNEGITDLGLHCRGSFNRYVSIPPCFIADEDFLKAACAVKDFANKNGIAAYNNKTHEGFFRHLVLRKAKNNNQMLVNIVTTALEENPAFFEPLIKELGKFAQSVYWTQNSKLSDAVISDKLTLLLGKENITEKLKVGDKDFYFNISPFSFFQTNSKGAEILYNEVLHLLNPSKDELLLDLYCGTGTIGICMADKVKKVIGIEQTASAIENAKTNALLNNIDNADFFASTAEKWVKENSLTFDAIIVDPPRSGLTNDIIKFLLASQARKIVYVSCNPATLARDLTSIISDGTYILKAITPLDMFPQTYHVENAVLLENN